MSLVARALLALSAIGIVATAFELTTERHWNGFIQLLPWFDLMVLTVALFVFCLFFNISKAVLLGRVLCVIALVVSGVGVLEHVIANFEAGVLDGIYGPQWSGMSAQRHLWLALTKAVGPAPPLAPGVLAQTAFLLLLASASRVRQDSATGCAAVRSGGEETLGA